MKIHEYQARDLLQTYQIPVPAGRMITSIEDAASAFKQVTQGQQKPFAVVKAQVHAGGRGKAGFVKLVRTPEEATEAARFMLTNRMKSPQTPPEGLEVKRLLIASAVDIADRPPGTPPFHGGHSSSSSSSTSPAKEEYYLAITTDRATRRNILIASREGGVEIETIAHNTPDAIIKEPLHPQLGLQPFQARTIAYKLGLSGKLATQAADIMLKLSKLYIEKDCSLAEINPLVIAVDSSSPNAQSPIPNASVLAIDAKFNFDENGLVRHKDIAALADPTEENPAEQRASKFGLTYIALDGNIGCLVNGAGLAMATMDVINLHGGTPANFLDVGGGATEEAVTEAFSIILSDKHVKGVLVNIFGGIMNCETIAKGIVNAATNYKNPDNTTGFKVPLVVRLEGTNVQAGRQLLENSKSKLPTLQAATDLTDAAKKVCGAVGR